MTVPSFTPPPYVTVYRSPLGWLVEVYDESIEDVHRRTVYRKHHANKPTAAEKRALVRAYLRRKNGDKDEEER